MGLVGVLLAGGAPWIVLLFFGEDYVPQSVAVFRILLPGFVVNALAFIPYSIVQGCGRPDITAKFHLIEFPIHLALLVVGYRYGGLAGVAFAWSMRVTLDCALLLYYCHHRGWLDGKLLLQHRALRNALVFLVAGAALSQLSWEASLGAKCLAFGIVIAVYIYTYLLGLSRTDRDAVWQFAGRRTDRAQEH